MKIENKFANTPHEVRKIVKNTVNNFFHLRIKFRAEYEKQCQKLKICCNKN